MASQSLWKTKEMSLLCPSGYRLQAGQCWDKCPPQMQPLATDNSLCVSTVPCPPNITTPDLVDSSACNKVVFPVNVTTGLCSLPSYTQWVTGECLANCPPGFVDNGQACLKRTVDRQSVRPSCSNSWYVVSEGSCKPGWAALTWSASLLLILLYVLSKMAPLWSSESCPVK